MGDPCGLCARREFVERTFLAALGTLVVSACGDGEIGAILGPPAAPLPSDLVITVSDFPDLAAIGGTARVDGGTAQPIAVSRTGTNSFVAVSMICPHAGYSPIDITSTGFRCPNHGATFNDAGARTGGQRTTDLYVYPTAYAIATDTLTIG